MASDLISREALLDSLEEAYRELKKIYDGLQYEDERRICGAQLSTFAELTIRVRKASTVDAEPIRHGTWENYPGHAYRRCSICKTEWEKPKFNIRSNYCPNCGAKMDGGKENGK